VSVSLRTSGHGAPLWGVEVVIRDGDRPVRRIAAGRRSFSPVAVGRDGRGKRVVVYPRCAGSCDLVAYAVSANRSRVIARRVVNVVDVTVGGGRVFWADGRRVRSVSTSGGRVRGEAVAPKLKPTDIDSDGTTLAATGSLPGEFDGGATGLSVTRVGSGRARLRAERHYSEEYAAMRAPLAHAQGRHDALRPVQRGDELHRFRGGHE
jgi:hypothetical protein